MAKTAAELRNKVLEKLGVLDAGGTAATSDATVVDEAYASEYERLKNDGLVTWGAEDNIPAWAVNLVRDIVADAIADAFNVPEPKRSRIEMQAGKAERGLIGQINPDYEPMPTVAEYF